MLTFNDTQIAFLHKSNKELQKAYWLFRMIENPFIVKIGSKLLDLAIKINFPIKWIIKPTVFQHFCGGETINDCDFTIDKLGSKNVGTILDYSAEGNNKESDFDIVEKEILDVIEKSKISKNIPFAVFKVTGLARIELLEKLNTEKDDLNEIEKVEFEKVKKRIYNICNSAYQSDLPVFIDAEESWIQNIIDVIAEEMMQIFNKTKPIVFNTIQLYRHDRLTYLNILIGKANERKFFVGLKLVRGAYMEKERERAFQNGYPSPIQQDKESTDRDYDKALDICIVNKDLISLCAGTHNEKSNLYLTELIESNLLKKNDLRFYFAQLLGMSDHISFNLSSDGYNVAKYVPYGPIKSVMPYLVRRAQENTSVAGQTGRELMLIKTEILRRKQK
jgi:proline dehydrogenase